MTYNVIDSHNIIFWVKFEVVRPLCVSGRYMYYSAVVGGSCMCM